jgi:hypothetical protein
MIIQALGIIKRLRVNKGYLESKLCSPSHDSCNGSFCGSFCALQHWIVNLLPQLDNNPN